MNNLVLVVQIIISVLLAVVILMQSQGSGMGASFGGGGEFYRSRRGLEKLLMRLTIILAVIFLITSIANIAIN
ncbi:preprotein translocase subunit SecG [Candidatus Gottesmanbacteria bacterium]|nr:preprotein translocase subunit SecG [Candidatus Gottesmanbacteria bacterium]